MDSSEINSLIEQFGPVGLLVAAALIAVRAYVSSGGSGVLSIFLNGLLKSQPTRAEIYGLHTIQSTSVVDPLRKILNVVDQALVKIQSNSTAQPATTDPPVNAPPTLPVQ